MVKTVGERIRERRQQIGMSAEQLGKKLNKDRATIYRYESGEVQNLPYQIVEPLSKALGVSPQYLMGWKTNEERDETAELKKVPMLGSVAAGEPIMVAESEVTYATVDCDVKVDFALQVQGDSMINARIADGDIAFVRRQPEVETGEIAVVLIDDEVTLKRFYRTNKGVILKPANDNYEPLFYSEQDFKRVRVLGKAVLVQSKL